MKGLTDGKLEQKKWFDQDLIGIEENNAQADQKLRIPKKRLSFIDDQLIELIDTQEDQKQSVGHAENGTKGPYLLHPDMLDHPDGGECKNQYPQV